MSTLRNIVFGCVSDHSQEAAAAAATSKRPINLPPSECRKSPTRVKFGVALVDTLKDDQLPEPLVDMISYIAREGVTTADLFRRPGNPNDLKVICKKLSEGRPVDFSNYNFYTLASVVKKFLLKIPGGVFGPATEEQLLNVLDIDDRMKQYGAIHEALSCLPLAGLQLVTLLFGTWFRIISHCEYNTMSSESVAKSIAGSLFHSCADNVNNINRAVEVLRILIEDFAVADMFGGKSLEYFGAVTGTGLSVTQHYQYHLSVSDAVTPPPNTGGQGQGLGSNDDSRSLVGLLPIFAQLVHNDVLCRGFDPAQCAVAEGTTCDTSHECTRYNVRNSLEGSASAEFVSVHYTMATPPSPHSLRQSPSSGGRIKNGGGSHGATGGEGSGAGEYNPGHKKLTHVSSLSAPEVNQGGLTPSPCVTTAGSASNSPFLSTSLCRFDSVRRRQLQRMRKRSDWFLSPSAADSTAPSDVSPTSPTESSFGVYHRHHQATCSRGARQYMMVRTPAGEGSRSSSVDVTSWGVSSVGLASSSDIGLSSDIESDAVQASSDLECPVASGVVSPETGTICGSSTTCSVDAARSAQMCVEGGETVGNGEASVVMASKCFIVKSYYGVGDASHTEEGGDFTRCNTTIDSASAAAAAADTSAGRLYAAGGPTAEAAAAFSTAAAGTAAYSTADVTNTALTCASAAATSAAAAVDDPSANTGQHSDDRNRLS